MALYKCDACNAYRDDPICEKCGRETREIQLPDTTLEEVARGIVRPDESLKSPLPRTGGEGQGEGDLPAPKAPHPSPLPAAAGRGEPEPPPAPVLIRGLDEFEALLDRGTKAVIICGDSKTGKSEIAYGFLRAQNHHRGQAQFMTLRAPSRTDQVLGGTVAGEVWFQVIDDKLAFLDPSGEFFKQLSPEGRRQLGLPDVTEEHFAFVRRAVANLAGVVLVVDLTRVLGPNDFSAWKRQEDDLNFILAALRWLRWDKEARPPRIGVSVNIAQRVSALPRLDKPVLVLFSKADQLPQYTNRVPLELARRHLPTLHGALMTHAKRYRYDFCHTMIRTGQGDAAIDPPCGVLLPMEWLLHDPLRWLPLQLPTRSPILGGGK